MSGYFVTGTDTGVGKTTVAAGILVAARRRGLQVAAVKPVESGCAEGLDGQLVAADASLLQAAAGGWQEADDVCPYRLRAPVAPGVAAAAEAVAIELGTIERAVERAGQVALFLVEGAGGLLVPLNDELTMADLAGHLGLELIIVGRDGLGTINHTALTVEVARRRGLGIAGIVLSACDGATEAAAQQNEEQIRRLVGPDVPMLGRLASVADATDLDALGEAAEALQLTRLFHVEQSTRR